MIKTTPFSALSNRSPLATGGRLAARGALIGSIVFTAVDNVATLVNTYWIKRIDSPLGKNLLFGLMCFVPQTIIAFALAFLPAVLGGALLAYVLQRDADKHALSRNVAVIEGVVMGGIAGAAICVPILILEYYFIQTTGHGSFEVFVDRTLVAVPLAAGIGGWVGNRLAILHGL